MIIPSFNQIAKITDSRYALVMLVSQRARKIVDGDEPLIDTHLENPVSIAIKEAVDGVVTIDDSQSDNLYFYEENFDSSSIFELDDEDLKASHIIGDSKDLFDREDLDV